MVKSASEQYGYYDEGYIFCPRSKRITANSMDKKRIDIDTVCRVAGHVDMKTTFMSYCFSLDHESAIQNKFEDVLRIG